MRSWVKREELYRVLYLWLAECIRKQSWEFPVGPVVRTRCFCCWGPGSTLSRGTKIWQAMWCSQRKPKKERKKRMQSLSVCWKRQALTTWSILFPSNQICILNRICTGCESCFCYLLKMWS